MFSFGSRWHTHLSVLPQVGPHARPVTSSHQDVVGEVVDTRQRAGKLAGARFVVVPHVGHHIIELQNFTPFVLFPEACVEGNFGTVQRRAVATGPGPLWTRRAGFTGISRRPLWARRPRKSRASSEPLFAPVVWKVWGLWGDGCQLSLWGGESVTHHLAAPKHLIMHAPSSRSCPFGCVDQ